MLRLNLEGADDLGRKLRQMQENARALDGEHEVPLTEVVTDDFVARHTRFSTLDEMHKASGVDVGTPEWSDFVAAHSNFADWQAMLNAAGVEYAKRKIGL